MVMASPIFLTSTTSYTMCAATLKELEKVILVPNDQVQPIFGLCRDDDSDVDQSFALFIWFIVASRASLAYTSLACAAVIKADDNFPPFSLPLVGNVLDDPIPSEPPDRTLNGVLLASLPVTSTSPTAIVSIVLHLTTMPAPPLILLLCPTLLAITCWTESFRIKWTWVKWVKWVNDETWLE
jgi:DNA segregation ATPase FtsK/SpoIIIE-like protein